MPEALAQRMRCGQRFELGDRLAVAPARELRLYPRRERGEPLLLEPRTLGGGQTGRRPDRPAPDPATGRATDREDEPPVGLGAIRPGAASSAAAGEGDDAGASSRTRTARDQSEHTNPVCNDAV
jgi:hypothetical protein